MASISPEGMKTLNDYLYKQGVDWARQYIYYRKQWLQKKGIEASSTLVNSLQSEVLDQLETQGKLKIEVLFATYGRFVDMKRLRSVAGGREQISNLERWIEQKGLQAKFTDRYVRNRQARKVPANILNQLAWAVAINRAKRTKRRRWYNTPTAASITELYNQVAAGLPDVVMQELKTQFKQA